MHRAELLDVGLFSSFPRYGDLTIHAVFDARRTFPREALERAARGTLADFPVLNCLYEPRFFKDRWVPSREPGARVVHLGQGRDLEAETDAWTRRQLDPTRERPFRVVYLPREGGCRLIVSLSHLAVDGGGMAAVGHVFGAHLYGVPPSAPVEPRRDLRRALGGLSWLHLPVLARDVAHTLLQPVRTFRAATRERPFSAEASAEHSVRHFVLEAAEVDALRARCGPGISVNDLLVAALARVSAARSSGGDVAAMYTMDLRRFSGGPHLSATNASSILTAVVPREATTSLPRAAQAVAAITARHRRGLVGPAFVLVPVALSALTPHGLLRRLVPGLHPLMVDLPLRRGLFVTNVGRVDGGLAPFGDDLEDMRIVGPNIRGVDVPAVVAFGLRGRVHLELFAAPGLGPAALVELERELRAALDLEPAG